MASIYYDFSSGTNGTGTSANPKNAWDNPALSSGDTVFFRRGTTMSTNITLSTGALGGLVKYTTYYNADGTDNQAQAKPIVNLTAMMSSLANHHDYVWIDGWDIRATITAANDASVIFLGEGSSVTNCAIDTNVGCIGSYGKNNLTITNNTFSGISTTTSFNNNLLVVSGAYNMDNILVQGNTFTHEGGGGSTSNAIRIESTLTGGAVTNLRIFDNLIKGTTGANTTCDNFNAIGMRIQNAPEAHISRNTVRGMLEGVWFFGAINYPVRAIIEHNILTYNRHFGIHLTTDAVGCTLQYNTCSFNGTSSATLPLRAYGRGIECSSAAGQSRCSNHLIRFNVCNGNLNYGGPNDNGSEGVGIGLDDGTCGCIVYANVCNDNEGNGIQLYGGSLGSGTPAITDTGGNQIVSNLLVNNCTASFTDRRTGGTFTNLFCSHISLASNTSTTDDRRTFVLNNVMSGTTTAGVSQDSNCTNTIVANNIFNAVQYPVMLGWTPASTAHRSNVYFTATQIYSTQAVDANGEPSFVLKVYSGTLDKTYDPELDSNYRPNNDSPTLADGFNIGFGTYDHAGGLFRMPNPSIGMYEIGVPHIRSNFGGNMRKKLFHGNGH